MNKVIIIGNLTKDPELSTTSSGIAVCKFTVAVSRPFKNTSGEQETDFLPIIVWRQQAENCGKYLRKGSKCAVEGSIQTRTYDDKDGNRRYMTEIIADRVEFIGGGARQSDEEFEEPVKKMPAGKKKVAELNPVDDDEDLPF